MSVHDGRSCHWSTDDPLNDGKVKPGLGVHDAFDVYAHFEHRGDVKKAVKAAAEALGMSHPKQEQGASVGSVSAAREACSEHWADPVPVPDELPPVAPFDFRLLPRCLRPWVQDIADRVQCPPDFPAVGAMVALVGIVGRKVAIRPKRHDDWTVVPNLWGAVIGRPGIMNTPALCEPLKPLKRREMEAKAAYEAEARDFEAAAIVSKENKKVAEGKIRAALKKGAAADAKALAEEAVGEDQAPPVRRRYLVNDSTVEKLGELLNQNPNGLTCYRDELVGLLKNLDRGGQEGARAFYLEAWNGNGRFTYDRIGRGTLDIAAACLSIIGGIQPGPLSEYLRGAAASGAGDEGLVQRFQLAVWPDVSREWVNVDRWPDTAAKNAAYAVFARLDGLTAASCGAASDEGDFDGVPYLRFCDEAQALFDRWRGGTGAEGAVGGRAPGGREPPVEVPQPRPQPGAAAAAPGGRRVRAGGAGVAAEGGGVGGVPGDARPADLRRRRGARGRLGQGAVPQVAGGGAGRRVHPPGRVPAGVVEAR